MEISGWTLEELADELGLSKNSTVARIRQKNIAPLFNGSIYPPDTYDRIKDAKVGRPKNPVIEQAEAALTAFQESIKTEDAREIMKKMVMHVWSMVDLAATIKGSLDDELLKEANEARLDRPLSNKEIDILRKAFDSIKNPKPNPPEE